MACFAHYTHYLFVERSPEAFNAFVFADYGDAVVVRMSYRDRRCICCPPQIFIRQRTISMLTPYIAAASSSPIRRNTRRRAASRGTSNSPPSQAASSS